ncbi:MAG: ABC transporter substrate-binding protein [Deltaproteobacteria bacterium]|nr:ABC transporter substrate-binding protein [Deltaproteobacteria bacterium]
MKRSFVLFLIGIALSAADAEAQQPKKLWRIGLLSSSSPSLHAPRLDALRQGLRELGYVEGQNIIMEHRYAEGKLERLPNLAAELVRLKVDVIVAGGTRVTAAAKQATSAIPIVVGGAGDLVTAGLVGSLVYPGGNVTGVSSLSPDLSGKRLELVREALPKAVRVAALLNPNNPGYGPTLKGIEVAVQALGLTLQSLAVRSPNDFESAFGAAIKGRADALFVTTDALFNSYLTPIVELAAKNRLPAMYDRNDFVEAGGLMSYGVNRADLYRRAAYYVDKILNGVKPADLPVEQPTKFELVINLKAAKALGLAIPHDVLMRANKVIQ